MRGALQTTAVGPAFELVAARVEPGRRVPLAGVMAALRPLALQVLETLDAPPATWRRDSYALRVRGNSLVDDGILDGDRIVVEASGSVRQGQTVVAEVDGHPTVKRWYREPDGCVRLEPANDRELPLVVRSDRVRLLGALVGVFRKHGFRERRPAAKAAPRSQVRGGRERDWRTLDLALRIVQHNLTEWERLIAADPRTLRRRSSTEAKALGQSLRALHATYAATESPRLRRALLDEAWSISRQMQAVATRLGWNPTEIRPLTL